METNARSTSRPAGVPETLQTVTDHLQAPNVHHRRPQDTGHERAHDTDHDQTVRVVPDTHLMETDSGCVAIATDGIQALQKVTDLLQPAAVLGPASGARPTREHLYQAAATLTRVQNMLDALHLDLANQYRDLVTHDLAQVDPDGRKPPLTGQRLADESRRATGQDLSPAWHVSPHAARARVELAKTSTEVVPECLEQVRSGQAGEDHLTVVLREAIVLDDEDQTRLDHDLAEQLPDMTVRQAKAEAFKRAAELDAATMVERAERATQNTHVSVRPAPDCMTRLSALLPLKDGVAIDVALTRHAQKLKATGDQRSLGQLKAALLVQWVRDGAGRADQTHTTWNQNPSGQDAHTTCQHGPHVEVLITITDLALLGHTDTPAHVDGHGAVPAGLARQIIAEAADENRATLRRLWTSPKDGTLTQMESTSRIFPKGLARYIRARDQICRTPYCAAPIRHIDHIHPHAAGGPTTATNGQGLCAACNQAKEHTHIRPAPPPELPHETGASLNRHEVEPPTPFPRTG
jgi:5-methylcytosine-specific restriction endonuclease McrA